MLRSVGGKLSGIARNHILQPCKINVAASTRFMGKHTVESDADLDARLEAYFNRPDIDGWEVRKGMNDIAGMDIVPEPAIIIAALKACRRLNDYALTVRFLESVKDKCGNKVSTIYPYIIQEIRPTLNELGISTPEELGYDEPELALKSIYEV